MRSIDSLIIQPASELKRRLTRLRNRNWQKRQVPRRILIIITPPRSGSTWFADAIRCHPAIKFWKTSVVFQELGLIGRRYPRDLSAGGESGQSIEVTPRCWDEIPDFTYLPEASDHPVPQIDSSKYAIEKIHPEFFDFDTKTFLKKLAKLEDSGVEIKLIYLLRDPDDCIRSFMAYQGRNPTWYSGLGKQELLKYMDQTFASVLELVNQRPGLVVNYCQVHANIRDELKRVYEFLWPSQNLQQPGAIEKICRYAERVTARATRATTGTPFLGNDTNKVEDVSIDSGATDDHSGTHLASCRKSYQLLTQS